MTLRPPEMAASVPQTGTPPLKWAISGRKQPPGTMAGIPEAGELHKTPASGGSLPTTLSVITCISVLANDNYHKISFRRRLPGCASGGPDVGGQDLWGQKSAEEGGAA